MNNDYSLWFAELEHPTPEDRRLDRTTDPQRMSGNWRIMASKMKIDWPVTIWTEVDETINPSGATIFQIGGKLQNTVDHAKEWADFVSENGSWQHCVAVSEEEYTAALKAKHWSDGKPLLRQTAEEKAGLVGEGNEAPIEDTLELKIEALADKIRDTPEPTTQAQANALSGLLDDMRSLLKIADAEFTKEKAPHLEAGRAVDTKWRTIRVPGNDAYDLGEARRKAFLKKEQAKRDAEVAAENKRRREEAEAEQARIAAERKAQLAKEAEEAAARGEMTRTEAEIEEIAEAEAAAEVVVEEVAPERVTAGSTFGRNSGLKKVKRGKIVDAEAFAVALVKIKHGDLMPLLQTLANRAAKAGMPQPGIEIEEVLE